MYLAVVVESVQVLLAGRVRAADEGGAFVGGRARALDGAGAVRVLGARCRFHAVDVGGVDEDLQRRAAVIEHGPEGAAREHNVAMPSSGRNRRLRTCTESCIVHLQHAHGYRRFINSCIHFISRARRHADSVWLHT